MESHTHSEQEGATRGQSCTRMNDKNAGRMNSTVRRNQWLIAEHSLLELLVRIVSYSHNRDVEVLITNESSWSEQVSLFRLHTCTNSYLIRVASFLPGLHPATSSYFVSSIIKRRLGFTRFCERQCTIVFM